MASTGVFNTIQGFNRTWAAVTSIRTSKSEIIGYRFECSCGTVRKFLDTYFHDCHGAARNALDKHHCMTQ